MVKNLMIIALCLVSFSLYAQSDTKAERRAAKREQAQIRAEHRAEQRRIGQIEDSLIFEEAAEAIRQLNFVMEADKIQFKYGDMAYVNPTTNFLMLDEKKATVQVAPFRGPGLNGVGGVTVEGKISDLEVREDKKGNIICHFIVLGNGISSMIDLKLYKGNNRADVKINPNFNSRKLTLFGKLIPKERSAVFKGRIF